jgi:hypothetical protein
MRDNEVLLTIGEIVERGADLDLSDVERSHLGTLESGSPTPSMSWRTLSRPSQYYSIERT